MSNPLLSQNGTFGNALDYLIEQAWDRNEWGNIKVTESGLAGQIDYSDTALSTWIKDQTVPPNTLIIDRIGKNYICTEEEYIWLMGVYAHYYADHHDIIPKLELARLEEASREFLRERSELNKSAFYIALTKARRCEQTKDEDTVTAIQEHFERENYYQSFIENLADTYPHKFEDFIVDSKHLASEGDILLKKRHIAAYDLTVHPSINDHYPNFLSNLRLIFYNNYLGRVREVVHLLTEMERQAIITREDVQSGGKVKLGVKAARRSPNKQDKMLLDRTVDVVLTFSPFDRDDALRIIDYLFELKTAIMPDIRATNGFPRDFLLGTTFREATSHYRLDRGELLVWHLAPSEVSESWHHHNMLITPEFSDYLSSCSSGKTP